MPSNEWTNRDHRIHGMERSISVRSQHLHHGGSEGNGMSDKSEFK